MVGVSKNFLLHSGQNEKSVKITLTQDELINHLLAQKLFWVQSLVETVSSTLDKEIKP